MGPIFIHADPRIPKSEVDFVAEKLVLSRQPWDGLSKFSIGDPETGWERVYALKKTWRRALLDDVHDRLKPPEATGWTGRARCAPCIQPDAIPDTAGAGVPRPRARSGRSALVSVPLRRAPASFRRARTRWWFSMESTRASLSAVTSRRWRTASGCSS